MGTSAAISFSSGSTCVLLKLRLWARELMGHRNNDVELLITELVTNAIEHGDPGTVAVAIERDEDEVIVAVTSPSSSKKPEIEIPSAPADPGTLGGRGLLIAQALSTKFYIDYRRDVVEVTAHIPIAT